MKISNPFFGSLSILSLVFAAQSLIAQIWVPSGSPATNWTGIDSSADGRILFAVATGQWAETPGPIYRSSNYGLSWTQVPSPTPQKWSDVACSADGSNVVVSASDGPIYVSTNSGTTWQLTAAASNRWTHLDCSADGSKLVAMAGGFNGRIYISINSGATWTLSLVPPYYAGSVAMSANGAVLAAVSAAGGDLICVSTNFGISWTSNTVPTRDWEGVAVSADGTKMAAASWGGSSPGEIYISMDTGTTWSNANAPDSYWHSIAMSADGTRLVVLAKNPPVDKVCICTSDDFGGTWIAHDVPWASWYDCASSADGGRLAAVSLAGSYPTTNYPVFVCQSTRTPKLELLPAGTNFTLSWTVPSTNLLLQANPDLAATDWIMVTNVPMLNLTNLHNEVTLPASAGSTFFRLKTP